MSLYDYTLSDKFDAAQRTRAVELLKWGAREGWTLNATQTRLQREGLGYRRQNMVEDFARAQVTGMSKTAEAEARADAFYDNVYKPFREETGLTRSQMGTIMRAWRGEIEVPDELADEVEWWGAEVEESGS